MVHFSKHSLVLATTLLLTASSGVAADALQFFNNYFVVGDYQVAGVGLRGKGVTDLATKQIVGGTNSLYAKGTISINGVPATAQAVSAFLYWQTIESSTIPAASSAAAKGTFNGNRISGKLIGAARSCWSSGGGSGNSNGAEIVRSYRADVLRHLPLVNKVRSANGSHTVALLDSGAAGTQSVGTGNQFARTEGASLVVVYRDLNQADPTARLRSVVLYDGGYTFDATNPTMTQTVAGFHQQLAGTGVNAKMTHIVGDGDPNFKESLLFNGTALTAPLVSSATDPFQGAQGQAWDNLTVNVSSRMGGVAGGAFTTGVVPVVGSVDCMSWSAIVFATDVQDTDNDGLLDQWEDDKGYTDVRTSAWVPLPGADKNKQDLYIEIDHMVSRNADGTIAHSHRPKNAALKLMADAFARTDLNVNLHVDIGAVYSQDASITRPTYIVPAANARGGDEIDERTIEGCAPGSSACPETMLGWRRGFQLITLAKTNKTVTASPRFFEASRRHSYHYAIFGHALSRKGVISKISGIADKPGSKILVTLGQWRFDDPAGCVKDPTAPLATGQSYCNDRVGNILSQAGTLMHELGHNGYLSHGGFETLNCKPNHVSVMNYSFQVRGVPLGNGALTVDFSNGNLNALTESALQEQGATALGSADANRRTRWYAPPSPLDLRINATLGNRLAKRYCDGTAFPVGVTPPQMVRVDGANPVSGWIDWNNDGVNNGATAISQDVNLSGGALSASYTDSNDWARFKQNLRQLAGGQGWSRVSAGVLNGTDLGLEDVGLEDVGLEDVGLEDVGLEDVGLEDVGLEDVGLEDVGLEDVGEVDYDVVASTVDPPTALNATIGKDFIEVRWTAPEFGTTYQYAVWRDPGTKGKGGLELIGTIQGTNGAPPPTIFKDSNVRSKVTYNYFVTAFACDSAKNSCRPGDLAQSAPAGPLTVTMP